MNNLSLRFENTSAAFSPGDQLIVDASWDIDERVEYLELRLFWYTRGKGDMDLETVQVLRIDSPARQNSQRMGVQLPDAPYSFSGKLISLVWALELVAEPSGDACRQEFVMAPDAKEIVLTAAAQEAGAP